MEMKEFMQNLKKLLSVKGLMALLFTSLGIGYLLSAIDLIPDTIPVIGYVDDAFLVIAMFFVMMLIIQKVAPNLGPKAGRK